MQHVHPLSSHSAVHAAQQQQPSTATMLLQGPVHPSASQLNMNASPASGNQTQPSTPQRHVANTSTGGGKGTTANGATGNCDLPKVDDPIHSTPSQTPVKQNEQDILNHDPQSHNSSSNLDVSSSSIKRDNNGTGHFV
ncbi:unnamed protein product [Echinostoma caproni]|uniref:Protein Smaug n=1 Tax=Echinostoma caproni TaxID=27848 RepID=A0A183B5D4_9TREM|nr:unnamed protein product [Echinostoma caproni]